MNTPSSSPTKNPGAFIVAGQMSFFDALPAVLIGKNITKLEWNDNMIYVKLDGGQLKIMLEDGLLHPLIVSEGDLRGTDWVVL